MAKQHKNYTEGLYEGREPVTVMEKYTVDFRDTFMRNYRASLAACARATGNFPYHASEEGLNPRIHCGESIPEKVLDKLD